MREKLTTALEVVGLTLVSVAAGLHDLSAGLAVAGLSLVLIGVTEGRK